MHKRGFYCMAGSVDIISSRSGLPRKGIDIVPTEITMTSVDPVLWTGPVHGSSLVYCTLSKTIVTTALPLVCTTLKSKVQGSNPVHDIFFFYVLMLTCESAEGKIVCNTPQPACKTGTPSSYPY